MNWNACLYSFLLFVQLYLTLCFRTSMFVFMVVFLFMWVFYKHTFLCMRKKMRHFYVTEYWKEIFFWEKKKRQRKDNIERRDCVGITWARKILSDHIIICSLTLRKIACCFVPIDKLGSVIWSEFELRGLFFLRAFILYKLHTRIILQMGCVAERKTPAL